MIKVVRAFPLLPGKEEAFENFVTAMNDRAEEVSEFYRRYKATLESWHLQKTPEGSLVIVISEIEDESQFAAHAVSQHPFDRWFKDQVTEISGISLDEMPRGASSCEAFCWTEKD